MAQLSLKEKRDLVNVFKDNPMSKCLICPKMIVNIIRLI